MGLFGKKPEYIPQPYVARPAPRQPASHSMDQALHNAELRSGNLESRIATLEAEIANYKREMQRNRPGSAGYNMYKRKALHAMRQRKSLESRASMASNAAFNLEQVRDAKYQQQDNIAMVQGMKSANEEIRMASQQVDLDEVDELQDEMQDVLADVNEVGNMLGRSYDVDGVDQTELEAELDELEQDSVGYGAADSLSTPSYLRPSPVEMPQPVPPQAHSSSAARPTYAPAYANPQGSRF